MDTCETCKHWHQHSSWGLMYPTHYESRERTGTCDKLANGGTIGYITIGKYGRKKKPPVDTTNSFGCILHESRP